MFNSLIYRISCKIMKNIFKQIFDFRKKMTIYRCKRKNMEYEIKSAEVFVILTITYLYLITLVVILNTI